MAQVSSLPQTQAWLRGIYGAAAEQALGGYNEFTPSVNVRYPVDTLRPSQAMTIDEGRRMHVDDLLTRLFQFTTSFDSWEFKVMPLKASDFMVDEWSAEITRLTLLQQTVEGLTPQLIEIEKERHAVRKKHWQQGFEMKGEFFMTPEGKREFALKYQALQMNVIATMQQQIKKAIMAFPDYWAQHQKTQGPVFPNAKETIAQEVNMHGVLNQDKGVYTAINHLKRRTRGDVRTPEGGFDVMVLASGQLEKAVYDADKPRETEAYRSGEANARNMLLGGADAMASKIGGMVRSIYEDQPKPATNKPMTELDMFKQLYISTAHFVINADALGPANARGVREPMVQALALPLNDWHTFRLSECCRHDPSFDDNGEIDDGKMQRLMNNLDAYLQQYDFSDGSVPDPFLWRIKHNMHNGQTTADSNTSKNFAKVEWVGDFEESVRDFDEDVDAANKMAENDGLTQEQYDLIIEFLMAVESVRVPPAAVVTALRGIQNQIAGASKDAMETGAYMDSEWGGPDLRFITGVSARNTAGAAVDATGAAYPANTTNVAFWTASKPYGFGSIHAMMSLLKSVSGNRTLFGEWEHRDLMEKYPKLKLAMDKMWGFVKRASPSNGSANQRFVPINSVSAFRDSGKSPHIADNARRCALFGSLLKGHAYPLFVATSQVTAASGVFEKYVEFIGGDKATNTTLIQTTYQGGAFKNVLDNNPPEQIKRAIAAGDAFKDTVKDWAGVDYEEIVGGFLETPEGNGLTPQNAWKALVMVTGYVLTLMDMKDADGKLDQRGVAAADSPLFAKLAADYDRHYRAPRGAATTETVMTPLHFGPRAWRDAEISAALISGNGQGFFPADTENPSQPIGQDPGQATSPLRQRADTYARSRFSRTRLGAKMPAGYNASTALDARSVVSGFAMEQGDHFIGATAGLQPGGPFVATQQSTQGDQVDFVERRNMIARFTYIKDAIMDPIKRMYGFVVVTSKPSLNQNQAFIDHGVPSMFGCIGVNIAIQQNMDALMLIKSGGDTGFLAHNYANSNFGQDPGHKELKFNLTLWMGAVVTNGANINILPGAGYAGYVGGLDSSVIKDRAALAEMGRNRANLRNGASMMFFVVPASYSRQKMLTQSNPCALGGKIDSAKLKFRLEPRAEASHNRNLPFPGWIRANEEYQFDATLNGRKPYVAYSYEALRRNQNIPMLSLHRQVREWNPQQGVWQRTYNGSAHIDNAGCVDLAQTISGEVVIGKRHAAVQDAAMTY